MIILYIYVTIYLYMIIYDYIYIPFNLFTSIQHHRFAASPLRLVQAFLHNRSGLLLGCLQIGDRPVWWKLSGNSHENLESMIWIILFISG